MKNLDIKKMLGLLGFMLRCPVCGFKNNIETMRVVESEQNEANAEAHLLIHSDCQQCKGSVMFAIGMHGPEVLSSASVTDLTLADTKRFRDIDPISPDEVLSIHAGIQKFDGDLVRALRK